jgi:membrane associated rhomboid family serine protease
MDGPTTPSGAGAPGPLTDPSAAGPLTRAQAMELLDRAAGLMATSDFVPAAGIYQRVIGHPDIDVTAMAMLGFGEALFRLDHEPEAMQAWQDVLRMPESPATYPAWRNVAAARVRSGDLPGALTAYREAERRAPAEDRAEIASRMGWLTKELGDRGASRRYFARARGEAGTPVTIGIIVVTSAITAAAWLGAENGLDLYALLQLDKVAVANGEYWRLWTAALLHAPLTFGILHLGFNMWALWIAGPIVERFYGSLRFLGMYLLCAAAGSVASFVFGGDVPSVGASGAIFGLFGIVFAVMRTHDPVVDRQTRAISGQLGVLIVINLLFGFSVGAGTIDNFAHLGGLVAGLWLGWLLVPTGVPTLASRWQRPEGGTAPSDWRQSAPLRWAGVAALIAVLCAGVVFGTRERTGSVPSGTEAGAPAQGSVALRVNGPTPARGGWSADGEAHQVASARLRARG